MKQQPLYYKFFNEAQRKAAIRRARLEFLKEAAAILLATFFCAGLLLAFAIFLKIVTVLAWPRCCGPL